jgi:alpha-tubulin suppressor-like RCC1 family protein
VRWLLVLAVAGCGRLEYDADASGAEVDAAAAPLVATAISSGDAHTCAIVGGRVACWGDGSFGAIGGGAGPDRPSPAAVGTAVDRVAVSAMAESTCGLHATGTVECWGQNDRGQLGVGDTAPRADPATVPLLDFVSRMAGGHEHACAIQPGSRLWCWGQNEEGQLGLGDTFPGPDHVSPIEMPAVFAVHSACAGQGHTCALGDDASLWCTGRNAASELGLGTGAPGQVRTMTRVGTATSWLSVACGQAHTCGIQLPGTLWCWGRDDAGQLGHGTGAMVDAPMRVGTMNGWTRVSASALHTCGIRAGELWCWGRNAEGQLGLGDTVDRPTPARVGTRTDWAAVAAGRFHTCALANDGSVWCTGDNGDGQLGLGDTTRRDVLTRVAP